jgi:hypothetical protein
MWSTLLAAPGETLAAATASLAVAISVLGVVVYRTEPGVLRRGGAAGQRPPARPARRVPSRPARHEHLSAAELARLHAYRSRARLMAGEPLRIGWWRTARHLWREGYSGWIIALLAGSFSMATHFGLLWLVTGGGWAGAAAVTVASTVAMVCLGAWIGLGLVTGR